MSMSQRVQKDNAATETQPLFLPTDSGGVKTTKSTTNDDEKIKEDGNTTNNEQRQQHELPTLMEDSYEIIKLAIPIFISSLSWVGKKTTDTALLGHVSSEALSASALSDLWTMCSQVFISGRILGVLVGGAVGAGNPKLAGIYLQVSYVVLGLISIVVFVLWDVTEQVWLAFGSDTEISNMAGYYARVLSFSIPGIVAFGQISQFFASQKVMYPEVFASSFGLVCNLVFGIIFVLGVPGTSWTGYGFEACPVVTMCVVYVQLLLFWFVFIYRQKLHQPCWDGWNMSEVTWVRVKTFCDLYIPASLSSASDFWRVAVIGACAAQLGEEEVAVFNTSYRIMWIALVMVGSLASASAIDMSIRLGRFDPNGARQAGYVGIALAASILIILSFGILIKSEWFGRIFTSDEEFLALFEEAKVPFTISLFFMNLSVAIERIPYSMGRTREIFWMGFVASWGGQVPGVILCIRYWRQDLVGLYTGMAIGYGMLVLLYSYIVFRSDWKHYAELAQARSEVTKKGERDSDDGSPKTTAS